MRATVWSGRNTVQVENVPDPKILNDRDAIVKISSTAICGSDLHLYDGYIPTMKRGDILGHEFMGEVVDVGRGVANLKIGDRVVVPFPIACGNCWHCRQEMYSACENSNPNAGIAEKMFGHPTAGIFGYSHITGGYAGGQAEYARVPYADVGPFKVDDDLSDEQVLFLSDIFPTGFMGADFCEITGGEVIAVFGAGPVGQFAIASAVMLGAERVIAVDEYDYRLEMARNKAGATDVINFGENADVVEQLKELTGGRGPDAVIDAVGMESTHGHAAVHAYDRVKQATRAESDRGHALRDAILSCMPGGIVSVIGVYGGLLDKFPAGAFMNKGLTMKTGQCHVHKYIGPLYERIRNGDIDPSFVVTHRLPLDVAPDAYETFKHKQDNCMKVVLKPGANGRGSMPFPPRPIDATLHGVTDYTAGAFLLTAFPTVAGIEGTRAEGQIRTAGAIHAGYSMLTDYPLGVVKVLPYKAHLALDAVGALALAATPFVTGQYRKGRQEWVPHVALCLFELVSLMMTDPTGRGDYHGDVETVRRANTEDPGRKVHDGAPAVRPPAMRPVAAA